MRNETHERIEQMAGYAGWSDFTLLVLICRWLEESDQSQALLDYLEAEAAGEENDEGGDDE